MSQRATNGAIAEAIFTGVALRGGWAVAKPYRTAIPYDFLVQKDDAGQWLKVQVKAAYLSKGNIDVDLRRGKGTSRTVYLDGEFDLLGAVYGNDVWLVPWERIRGMKSLRLNAKGMWDFKMK